MISSTNSDNVTREAPIAVLIAWQDDVIFLPRITTRAQNSASTGKSWYCFISTGLAIATGGFSVCPSAKSRISKPQPRGKHHERKNAVNNNSPENCLRPWYGDPAGQRRLNHRVGE
jgi:hypothetical protein